MKTTSLITGLCVSAAILAQTSSAGPTVPLLGVTGTYSAGFTGGPGTVGSSFTVGNAPIQITALGDLLGTDYAEFGVILDLWDSGGSVLAEVPQNGNTALVVAGFSYTPIAPLTLSAHATYVIGESTDINSLDQDIAVNFPTGSSPGVTDASVTYDGGFFSFSVGFPSPGSFLPEDGISGPNALLIVEPTPEPSTLAVGALGAGALSLFRRRRETAAKN